MWLVRDAYVAFSDWSQLKVGTKLGRCWLWTSPDHLGPNVRHFIVYLTFWIVTRDSNLASFRFNWYSKLASWVIYYKGLVSWITCPRQWIKVLFLHMSSYHLFVYSFLKRINTLLLLKVQVKVTQLCLTLWPHDCTFHSFLQARIPEWVAVPFSRGSSQPRDQTQVSHISGRFFY